MLKTNYKNFLINAGIVLTIFLIDRISKIYILKLAEQENGLDIYIVDYLNLYLIWNKGIAFGLLSFGERNLYNIITGLIILVTIIVIYFAIKAKGIEKYSFMMICGGSIGNIFDRLFYQAVPDFIDIHYENFHWFIFNVADIFITLGVFLLIFREFGLKIKN